MLIDVQYTCSGILLLSYVHVHRSYLLLEITRDQKAADTTTVNVYSSNPLPVKQKKIQNTIGDIINVTVILKTDEMTVALLSHPRLHTKICGQLLTYHEVFHISQCSTSSGKILHSRKTVKMKN